MAGLQHLAALDAHARDLVAFAVCWPDDVFPPPHDPSAHHILETVWNALGLPVRNGAGDRECAAVAAFIQTAMHALEPPVAAS